MIFLTIFNKLKLYIILISLLGAAAYAGYYYYKDTQARLTQYAINQERLQASLAQQIETTETLLSDIDRLQATMQTLNTEFTESRRRVSDLETRFNQNSAGDDRDIGELAAARPGLVEKVVNTATQDVFRCLELLSGSQAAEGEADNANIQDCITNIGN